MRQLDYNLPPTHPTNQDTARALGLVWSEQDRLYINRDGSFPTGSEGSNDTRWGHMSESDIVHAHK